MRRGRCRQKMWCVQGDGEIERSVGGQGDVLRRGRGEEDVERKNKERCSVTERWKERCAGVAGRCADDRVRRR